MIVVHDWCPGCEGFVVRHIHPGATPGRTCNECGSATELRELLRDGSSRRTRIECLACDADLAPAGGAHRPDCIRAEPARQYSRGEPEDCEAVLETVEPFARRVVKRAMDREAVRDAREALKPRPDLIPARALLAAGRVMAQRTDRDAEGRPGYLDIPITKYRGSLARHVLAYLGGQTVDPDSGESPLAHVVTNAAILWEKETRAIDATANAEEGEEEHSK